MILSKTLSLLVAAAATSTIFVVEGAEMMGYLMDNRCISLCEDTPADETCTPDNANSFYTPQEHTGGCLLLPVCEQSRYSLMSAEPDATGRHSVVLSLSGDDAHASAVDYITKTNKGWTDFPLVSVIYEDDDFSVTTDGTAPQVVDAIVQDPWTNNTAAPYTGDATTQTICATGSDANIDTNNMCFRSDVMVSKDDAKNMIVIESGGCPDHENMSGGSGKEIANTQPMPAGVDGGEPVESGSCGCGTTDPVSCGTSGCLSGCSGAVSLKCPDATSGDWNETMLEDGSLIFKHAVVMAKYTAERSILCARLESDTEAYIGFGISPDGTMEGGEAVIGLPGDDSTVKKYTLSGARSATEMPADKQTLMDASITQEDGKTLMVFTKYLEEEGENEISATEENTFLYALGSNNALGFHAAKDSFRLTFEPLAPSTTCSSTSLLSDCGASTGCCVSAGSSCSSCAGSTCGTNACGVCSAKACGVSQHNCAGPTCGINACGVCSANTCSSCAGSTCGTNACGVCSANTCSSCSSCAGSTCGINACGVCSANTCDSKTCGSCGPNWACGACDANSCGGCDGCGSSTGSCTDTKHGMYDPMYQHYTMMIPQDPGTPGDATKVDDNVVGIMTNGVLLDTHEQTWSYDGCNGHSDTKHQYHYHIPPICYLKSMGIAGPEKANWWIDDNGEEVRPYEEMSAQWPSTGVSPVVGWARDGHPIYAIYDASQSIQRSKAYGGDLDECNGKDDGNGYAYYITAEPPFVPTCLKGTKGSFAYAPTNNACPKMGITNTIEGLSLPQVEVVDVTSPTTPSPTASSAYAKFPILSALFTAVVGAMAFFV